MVQPEVRMIRLAAVASLFAVQFACMPAKSPVRMSFHDGADDRTAVLFLPGFAASDRTIARKGVIDAMRDAGLQADVITVDARVGYYARGTLAERLEADVMPLVRAKYDHIWVMGISMGGYGTLWTADAFEDDVEGIVLFSPFLGRGRVLRSVEASGLQAWTPPEDPKWDDDTWAWLQRVDAGGWNAPVVYFGRGSKEDGSANQMFASLLPEGRVRIAEGGHQWKVWRELAAEFVREDLLQHEAFRPPDGVSEN
jgi:pimeloyl-ACP methyl ester carboxylesterase